MSSFICSPLHFNSIEKSIESLLKKRDFNLYRLKDRFPNMCYRSGNELKELEIIMDNLRVINAVCVSLQYKSHYEGVLDQEIREQTAILIDGKKSGFKNLDNLGLYQALRCLNYQIEIEHLKDLAGLTTDQENAMFFLKEFSDILAHHIVSKMPQLENIGWSL
jgi:hypothetical protein